MSGGLAVCVGRVWGGVCCRYCMGVLAGYEQSSHDFLSLSRAWWRRYELAFGLFELMDVT